MNTVLNAARPSSDALLAAIINSSSDAIVSKDLDGTITSWNPGAERIFGYRAEEVIGRNITLLFPPDRYNEEPAIMARIRRGESVEHFQTVRCHKDGSFIDISLTVSPVRDDSGRIIGASKIARDISRQVREREMLRLSEIAAERLAAIVNGSDDAIVGKDLTGIVTDWNPGAEKLFGYTRDEMIGHSILRLLPPERIDEEQHILARLQRGERVHHFETVRRHKDGHLVNVSLTISPIRDHTGTIIGASKIARDITALKQAQQRLEQHATELEEKVRERTARLQESLAEFEAFSYSLSHDMRAPLRAIQSLTEIVVADYGARFPEGIHYLQKVIIAANRLDRLIRDVLSFARISRSEIVLQPMDVDALVRELLAERPEYHAPDVTITLEGKLLPAVGHEASLTQCLVNLLDNAIKYVAPGVKPIITLFSEATSPDRMRLSVRDNGIGIDPTNKQRLFDLFERLPTAQRYEGTGVGLAIVRKAVARMHGTVGVESAAGLGSTFWIELPRTTR